MLAYTSFAHIFRNAPLLFPKLFLLPSNIIMAVTDADKPWGRRLVICCDGTWQTSVTEKENVPSNVTKLCRLIKRHSDKKTDSDRKWHQLVYYDSGIGTGNLSGVESARQGASGAGLMENVIEAYNFLVLNYQEGDEIFTFGFSRGAFTARAVAGLVADIGIIKPLEMQFFPRIYRAYMKYGSKEETDEKTKENVGTQAKRDAGAGLGYGFRESKAWQKLIETGTFLNNKPPSEASRGVKVVGVWDTVGSLGVPDVAGNNLGHLRKQFGFHNVKLSKRKCTPSSVSKYRTNGIQTLPMHTTLWLWMNADPLSDQPCGTSIQNSIRNLN